MPRTIHDKLDYLARSTGRAEAEIVAEAIEEGLTELYRKQIANAYIAGELDRAQAITELGEEAVEDLDYARSAVEKDVQWGLMHASSLWRLYHHNANKRNRGI